MGSELVRTRDICPGYLHVPSDFALLNALGALASVDARLELGVDLLGDVGGVLDGHDLSAVVCPLVHDLSLGVMISGRAVVKSGKSADGEFGADGERGVLRRGGFVCRGSHLLEVLAGAVLLGAAHVGVSRDQLLEVEKVVVGARILGFVRVPTEALAGALRKSESIVLAPC